MCGEGSRFLKKGYQSPKPLIEINGKPFLYWSSMSILRSVEVSDMTFVVLKRHVDKYKINERIYEYFSDARIKILLETPPGPVYTAIEGVNDIHDDAPIIINDCDHILYCREFNEQLQNGIVPWDGALLTFESNLPQYSYVRYNTNGRIIGTAEKQVVSNHAICGAYSFRNAELFRNAAATYIQHSSDKEKYMSGVYSVLCDQGMIVQDYQLDYHVEFGTPLEYEKSKGSYYFLNFK